MVWVKADYAEELSVLAAWLSLLLPWNVVYLAEGPLGSKLVFLRFPLAELQVRWASQISLEGQDLSAAPALVAQYPGTRLAGDVFLATPVQAMLHYNAGMFAGSLAWTVGAVAILLAFGLSLWLYVAEDAVAARLPVDPVRLMGWLLAAVAGATAVATVFYWTSRNVAGVPIPVGVPIVGLLALALLRAERV
jgi:hypothetical protein